MPLAAGRDLWGWAEETGVVTRASYGSDGSFGSSLALLCFALLCFGVDCGSLSLTVRGAVRDSVIAMGGVGSGFENEDY